MRKGKTGPECYDAGYRDAEYKIYAAIVNGNGESWVEDYERRYPDRVIRLTGTTTIHECKLPVCDLPDCPFQ